MSSSESSNATTSSRGSAPLCCATAGSVDDGKSTLIGRLLYDTKTLMRDQLEHVEDVSRRRGVGRTDLALLTDGLRAEREQGITIDVAWRYFATPRRRFVLADSPGHVQYTRNMVTAASHADVAIILVDARRGTTEQTRRHLFVSRLLGVPHVVVAVNKMDQVDFAHDVFARMRDEITGYAEELELPRRRDAARWTFVPVSALHGDNVVDRSAAMPWYDGPTLLAHLESLPTAATLASLEAANRTPRVGARLPVQLVLRPQSASHPDFRGFAGRLEMGTLRVGQSLVVASSGLGSVITGLHLGGAPIDEARAGDSVVVELKDDIDISRGDLLVGEDGPAPRAVQELEADVAWLNARPAAVGTPYIVKHGTREVKGEIASIDARYDIASGRASGDLGAGAAMNEIVRLRLKTRSPLPVDSYAVSRATGSFVLVDTATAETVGAGMIR
jgi:sulfate adenylyltransferase subunit 1